MPARRLQVLTVTPSFPVVFLVPSPTMPPPSGSLFPFPSLAVLYSGAIEANREGVTAPVDCSFPLCAFDQLWRRAKPRVLQASEYMSGCTPHDANRTSLKISPPRVSDSLFLQLGSVDPSSCGSTASHRIASHCVPRPRLSESLISAPDCIRRIPDWVSGSRIASLPASLGAVFTHP